MSIGSASLGHLGRSRSATLRHISPPMPCLADRNPGGAGRDVLDGGTGSDRTIYAGSDAGVTVNLATGTGLGGHAEGDTLTAIENLTGSVHSDALTGDDNGNRLTGSADGPEGLTQYPRPRPVPACLRYLPCVARACTVSGQQGQPGRCPKRGRPS